MKYIAFLPALLLALSWGEIRAQGDSAASPELATFAGEYRCRGNNPDGTSYEGVVRVRVKDGLVLMEWNVGGKKSYGSGLVEGSCLGVALDDGVAIYQIVPQGAGLTLIGLWATEGAKSACEEIIFVGEAKKTDTKFPVLAVNGAYRATIVAANGAKGEESLEIAGGDMVKQVLLKDAAAQGLLLGDGLAIITPTGLAVFHLGTDQTGGPLSLSGHFLEQTTISRIYLTKEPKK